MKIPNKPLFEELQLSGKTGNYFEQWRIDDPDGNGKLPNMVARAIAGGSTDMFYIRGPRPDWPHTVFWCPAARLMEICLKIQKLAPTDAFSIMEVTQPGGCRANMQYRQTHDYMDMTFGTSSSLSLREDIAANESVSYSMLKANQILRAHVPPEDVDMLFDLMAEYPGAIFEVSAYSRPCGVMDRKTIVWEIRHY